MLKEGFEYLASLGRKSDTAALTENVTLPSPIDGEDEVYSYRVVPGEYGREFGELISPLRPDLLSVTTLTSFVDALDAEAVNSDTGEVVVHIEEPTEVTLKTSRVDAFGKRNLLMRASYHCDNRFDFDHFYTDLPRFVIRLQTAFAPSEQLEYLVKLASNLKAGSSVQSADNGFSQVITFKTGEISTGEVTIKPVITLRPIRTFAEIDPVASDFLIRFQPNGNQPPSIALFNVGGDHWRVDTMQTIKEYLKDLVGGIKILA